jgi:tetratricopeptide (TPR) repeat protein
MCAQASNSRSTNQKAATNRRIPKVVFLCVVLTSIPIAAAVEDRVDLRDGKLVAGRIISETAIEVVVQNTSGSQRVPVNQIGQIHYEGQPATLTHARTMEDSSKLNQAADEYAKVQDELKNKPFVLQAARFGEARVRARLALDEGTRLDESIERLENVDREYGNSRHHFLSQELLGRLYFEKNEYRKAALAFDELSTAPWREAKLHAAVYQARLLRAEKRLDEAMKRLDPELEAKPESPDQELICCEVLLEKAQVLRAMDRRPDEADVLEQAIDRLPAVATALQAEAYVALGDACNAIGRKWDAVRAFLHVQLLFAKHEELHARALYNLTQLWSELGRSERAAATHSMLKTEHPKSDWTRKLGS